MVRLRVVWINVSSSFDSSGFESTDSGYAEKNSDIDILKPVHIFSRVEMVGWLFFMKSEFKEE